MSELMRREATHPKDDRSVLRELIVFEVKLAIDGLKDIVLAPLAIVAALWDLALDGGSGHQRLDGVLRLGESFERWLNLYSRHEVTPAERTTFGQAGSDLLIDQIEGLAKDAHESIGSARSEKKKLRRRGRSSDPDSSGDR